MDEAGTTNTTDGAFVKISLNRSDVAELLRRSLLPDTDANIDAALGSRSDVEVVPIEFIAALDTDLALDEVAAHREDEEWLGDVANDYVADGNAEVYYTEVFPDDYTPDEQRELAVERPDLFTAEEIEGLADPIDPRVLEDGGIDLDEASNEMRGIADGLAARQVESPDLDGRDR